MKFGVLCPEAQRGDPLLAIGEFTVGEGMPFLGPDPDFPSLVSGSVETADPALARAEDDVGIRGVRVHMGVVPGPRQHIAVVADLSERRPPVLRAPDAAAHGLHLDDHRERQNAVDVLTRSQDGRPGVDTAGVE